MILWFRNWLMNQWWLESDETNNKFERLFVSFRVEHCSTNFWHFCSTLFDEQSSQNSWLIQAWCLKEIVNVRVSLSPAVLQISEVTSKVHTNQWIYVKWEFVNWQLRICGQRHQKQSFKFVQPGSSTFNQQQIAEVQQLTAQNKHIQKFKIQEVGKWMCNRDWTSVSELCIRTAHAQIERAIRTNNNRYSNNKYSKAQFDEPFKYEFICRIGMIEWNC